MEMIQLLVLLLVSTTLANPLQENGSLEPKTKMWWHNTIIYQIYPRSFQDSDGDGTGDLKGIEARLDYLQDLQVGGIWLSPIYKSPMKDFGYDVSDFKDIDPIFGNLGDFKDLINACHDRGIKLIMDFIPNHSSDEHEWFLKSLNRTQPFTDYYVWADPKGYDENGNPIPPSNWVSVFRNSAWTYYEERKQYNLHQFLTGQPDFNYRNPLVLDEMKDILKFWMNLGVDGFRMDAVGFLFEDDQYLDEPPISGGPADEDDYGHYDHIYTYNLPETRNLLEELYNFTKEQGGEDRLVMVEFYGPNEDVWKYYQCSDFPFNFGLLNFEVIPITAEEIGRKVIEWDSNVWPNKVNNFLLGNHDQHRVGSRFGEEYINVLNMITLSLEGATITYQGEEIGMVDNLNITFQQSVDPAGCNCGPDHYLECSRDPERTPLQWSNQKNAGFSNADKCWLPVNENFEEVNVDAEQADLNSSLSIYKEMAKLKNNQTKSQISSIAYQQYLMMISKCFETNISNNITNQLTVVNFSNSTMTVEMDHNLYCPYKSAKVLASSMGLLDEEHPKGSPVDPHHIVLRPLEALAIVTTN